MRIALTEQQAQKIVAYNSKKWGLLKAPKEVTIFRDRNGLYLNPVPEEGRETKIAVIKKIYEIGEGIGPAVGEYVVVPDFFPDEVEVETSRRGSFVRLGRKEFRVWGEATPAMAWLEYYEQL